MTTVFDEEGRLRLVNSAGERLLGRTQDELIGVHCASLGLGECLEGRTPRVMDMAVGEGLGRWELRRRSFRQDGRAHQLVVLADLSQVLREEERMAWQRLVRVLSHEINNSLTPIKSIAESLRSLLAREEPARDATRDLREGLEVISGRSEALGRFMSSYARLAKLPEPRLAPLDVGGWVGRIASLETRIPIAVEPGPDVSILADGDQLDQLLINLLENAADAALETGGGVRIGWSVGVSHVEVWIEDGGPGIADTANLFVPFFTTKPNGSGIGLALSRQIAGAHAGGLTLANRRDGTGCVARVRLPRRN
ncbi:MAG: PAS domain-containing sensor histidine kinase [Gemmatimonadota bacterium]